MVPLKRHKRYLVAAFLVFSLLAVYHIFWGQYVYTVTAYCNCPICINVPEHHDGQFASGRGVYWGGVATDSEVPFGTQVEIVPHWPQDWLAVANVLKGQRTFVAEDRGGKIKGRHIDLFIPDALGGHQAAKAWGKRHMRLKLDGALV